MARVLNDELISKILTAVAEIPAGTVATYGQIAARVGRPNNARLVGRVLKTSFIYGDFPCHRVVNSAGRLAPGFAEQAELLKKEGITFKDPTHIDLKKYQMRY